MYSDNTETVFVNLYDLLNEIKTEIDRDDNVELIHNYNNIVEFMKNMCMIKDNRDDLKICINNFLHSNCINNLIDNNLDDLLINTCLETLKIIIDLSYKYNLYEYINFIKEHILNSLWHPYNMNNYNKLNNYLNNDIFKTLETDIV